MSPEEATFDKAAAADVVFTLEADTPLVKVMNGSAKVNAENYVYDAANETMTLKKEYLATLTNGDKTFKFCFGDDEYLSVTVTVTGETPADDPGEG